MFTLISLLRDGMRAPLATLVHPELELIGAFNAATHLVHSWPCDIFVKNHHFAHFITNIIK
jgi:hypothetical protein